MRQLKWLFLIKALMLLLTLLLSMVVLGQKISIGCESGIISSHNTKLGIMGFKTRRNALFGGANFNYITNSKLVLSTGIQYLQQGYSNYTCGNILSRMDYLAVPITVSFGIRKSKSQKWVMTLGLLGAYSVQARNEAIEPTCDIGYSTDINEFTKDYSLLAIVGVGYKLFESDKYELLTNFKYYQGITNTFDNSFVNSLYSSFNLQRNYRTIQRNNSLVLTIIFNYKFGAKLSS